MGKVTLGFALGWLCCWAYFFVYRLERTKVKLRQRLELFSESIIPSDVLKEVAKRKGP